MRKMREKSILNVVSMRIFPSPTLVTLFMSFVRCLMVYQPSWVILCQIHPSKRTVVILFNPYLRYKGVHTFPKSIYPKVNAVRRLDFEFVYYDLAVQRFKHFTTWTLPSCLTKAEEPSMSYRSWRNNRQIHDCLKISNLNQFSNAGPRLHFL